MIRCRAFLTIFMFLPVVTACSSDSNSFPPMPEAASTTNDAPAASSRLSGSVIFQGEAPEPGPITVGGDAYCKKNAMGIYQNERTVTVDGKLRNVIVYVKSGYEKRTYPVPIDPVVLDQQGCVYMPRVLTVMKGQKLRILNGDPTFHNVHALADGRSEFNIAQPSKGSDDIQTFSRVAMPFKIGCDFHGWMVAYAGVFEHPFHTTSGETGKYELKLPPGKYEIVAWHPKYGEQKSAVEVGEAPAELNFMFSATGASK
jgi:hypothetical protein